MVKDVHRFHCPCCRKEIEFDARSKQARPVRFDASGDDDALRKLVDAEKHEGDRLDDVFSQAAREQGRQADRFDDLFSDALDQAKEDKDEKPPSPFDLD